MRESKDHSPDPRESRRRPSDICESESFARSRHPDRGGAPPIPGGGFCTQSGCPDGAAPNSGLVQGNNGELYGTTSNWGAHGFGTVFKITPAGTLTTLYSFCSEAACSDGVNPQGGLVEATNGYYYGTTQSGGTPVVLGHGTIFRMSPSGTLTTLHTFCAQTGCADGIFPQVWLQASDGNLYGTTASGGASGNCTNSLGCGTIFKADSQRQADNTVQFLRSNQLH